MSFTENQNISIGVRRTKQASANNLFPFFPAPPPVFPSSSPSPSFVLIPTWFHLPITNILFSQIPLFSSSSGSCVRLCLHPHYSPTWLHLPSFLTPPRSTYHSSPQPFSPSYWLSPPCILSPDAGSDPETLTIPLPPHIQFDLLSSCTVRFLCLVPVSAVSYVFTSGVEVVSYFWSVLVIYYHILPLSCCFRWQDYCQ